MRPASGAGNAVSVEASFALAARLRAAGCVFAEDEARLLLAVPWDDAERERRVVRREVGEPLETILGFVEFGGLRLVVESGVFVPRQRTLFLARRAVRAARPLEGAREFEVFAGVAPVAAYVQAHVPGARVHASDIDPIPLRCARRNLGAEAIIVRGDGVRGLDASRYGPFDVIVAVVPYVPDAEFGHLPREATEHEPRRALVGGADGLGHARSLLEAVPGLLADRGVLLLEVHTSQAAALARHARTLGFSARAETAPDGHTAVVAVHDPMG